MSTPESPYFYSDDLGESARAGEDLFYLDPSFYGAGSQDDLGASGRLGDPAPTGGNPNSGPLGLTTPQWISLLGALGPAVLGLGGVIQGLAGGDRGPTTTVRRAVGAPGSTESAAAAQALGLLGNAGALVPGLASVIQGRMPGANMANEAALAALLGGGAQIGQMQSAMSPLLQRLPQLAQQQSTLLEGLAPAMQPGTGRALTGEERVKIGLPREGELEPERVNEALARYPGQLHTSTINAMRGQDLMGFQRDAVAGLTPQAMGQMSGLLNDQRAAMDPAAQYRVDPALMSALNAQALGAAQGQLPALNDTLRGQIGQIYEGRMQDINRYVDTGLLDALDRARQMGFAGGMEVFREGAPGALVDRTMAEATRQRGTLAGQQAEQELALAQALPLLGSRLATEQANIGFSGNTQNRTFADTLGGMMAQRLAIPQLASGMEAQRVNTRANAAGAFTTPMSVALQGGNNLINLNQSLAKSLGDFGGQPISQANSLLGALSGNASAANQLSHSQQLGRISSADETTAKTQPFSLLDAYAPTAQLLTGTAGLVGAFGRAQNPQGVNSVGGGY